ncbi:MAG: DUF4388 domain-containing protein [Candidatus Sericytochromatia bacterium]|nr:DUF4388 domain-containing protein [Candidatus Sericytochromatia bacterium]
MAKAVFRIFIFEDHPEHIAYLKKLFQVPGCQVFFENRLAQATQRFKSSPFDLSIVSLDMPDHEGDELATWLIENYPRRSVILTGSEALPEHEDLLNSKSVLGFFPAPLDPQIMTRVMSRSDSGLRGQVQRMQIPDLLQALRWSHKAIVLNFQDAVLQQDAAVYMQRGEVVHVEIYQRHNLTQTRELLLSGAEAFDALLNFRNGTFSEQIWQVPSEYSIQIPFDGLMMNAAQRKDEARWDDADEGPRIRRAILIDDQAMSRMMLQQALLAEGIDCQSLRSLELVQTTLEAQQSDLLILDAALGFEQIQPTLRWLKAEVPNCRVLLLGNPEWADQLPVTCQLLPRPISPKRLKEVFFELTQVGFRGYLNRIGVLEFLQLNLSAIDDCKKMHIRDLSNGVDGQIYIDRGRFVHAQFAELTGEEAFYRIAAIEKGDFFEDPAFEPPARTLAEHLPHKLMINAGRFVKPLEDLDDPLEESDDTELTPDAHLSGVADKLNASDNASAGALDLLGEDDLAEISLNLPGDAAGGVTSLFGDDEVGEIQLNLGGGQPADAGGMTSLFGDDDMGEIQLNLGGGQPADAGGMTSLFGDDEASEIQLNLGEPSGELAADAEPVTAASPQVAPAMPASDKINEMRAKWAERRAQLKTGPLPELSETLAKPAPAAGTTASDRVQAIRARFAQIRQTGPLP